MSWANSSAKTEYKDALEATESLDSPAVGFLKCPENQSVIQAVRAVIKQNNTLIELLLQLHQRISELEVAVETITKKSEPVTAVAKADLDKVIEKLAELKLGPAPRKNTSFFVFKNPKTIFAQVKEQA